MIKTDAQTGSPPLEPAGGYLLVAAVFLLAICGLIYELIAGTLSSYLLGDSITHFSLVIGLFLTAMGIGSFLSKSIQRKLLARLAAVEIAVGLVGGSMALVGFAVFSYSELYTPTLLGFVVLIGILVGLEIPLLIRILQNLSTLRITLAHVLSADYLGALAASLAFPFLLLPHVGLVRAGMLMGLLNVLVAAFIVWRFRPQLGADARPLLHFATFAAVLLGAGMVASGHLVSALENRAYQDEIIFATDTPYQRVVLTRWREDIRLFLNGHLQFSSVDEYRYHETLVHPAMQAAARTEYVLVLGGGDGLATREILKYPDVQHVDLVDIDAVVTRLFQKRRMLTALNQNALNDPRVTIHHMDAMRYLEDTDRFYDVILIDLPDPSAAGLGKLYSRSFYRLVKRRLASGGTMASQCTSPFRSREAFWCIVHTMRDAFESDAAGPVLHVWPYHTLVPTFGTWGFVVATPSAQSPARQPVNVPTRYLSTDILPGLFTFPADMAEVDTPVSHLDNPVVCQLYRQGYHKYLE